MKQQNYGASFRSATQANEVALTFMKTLFQLCLVGLLAIDSAPAQVITDPVLQQTVLKTLDEIYNFDFAGATQHIQQLRSRYPQSPVGPMLRAVQLQWQYIPLKDKPTANAQYGQACEQVLSLAKKRLDQTPDDPEGIFFALTAHAYLALRHQNEGETMKAVGEARRAYTYMKQGFGMLDRNPEFYFTTGLYNYYVERYPQDHAIVKPAMVFFRDGDMALGLRQLETATKRAMFTRAESAYYLAHIFLEHESQPGRAAAAMKPLIDRYPNNPVLLIRYAESLLLAGRYADARLVLGRLQTMTHTLLPLSLAVFEGVLAEKEAADDKAAARAYETATRLPYVEMYTREYRAMAYLGLARIAARGNNRPVARSYYKKAADLGEYKSLHREAKAFR